MSPSLTPPQTRTTDEPTILFTVETEGELRRGLYPSIASVAGCPWEESPVQAAEIRFGCSSSGRLSFHNCATRGLTLRDEPG